LWFDFVSVVDHAHHAMMETTQDFFIEISLDVDWVAAEFSYADEMQQHAKDKARKREMILGILVGITLVVGAITAGVDMFGTAILDQLALIPLILQEAGDLGRFSAAAARASRAVQKATRAVNLPSKDDLYGQGLARQLTNLNSAVGGIIGGGFIGAQGLMQQYAKIKHGDDT
jgi:hypothetical protein